MERSACNEPRSPANYVVAPYDTAPGARLGWEIDDFADELVPCSADRSTSCRGGPSTLDSGERFCTTDLHTTDCYYSRSHIVGPATFWVIVDSGQSWSYSRLN